MDANSEGHIIIPLGVTVSKMLRPSQRSINVKHVKLYISLPEDLTNKVNCGNTNPRDKTLSRYFIARSFLPLQAN